MLQTLLAFTILLFELVGIRGTAQDNSQLTDGNRFVEEVVGPPANRFASLLLFEMCRDDDDLRPSGVLQDVA